MRILIPLHGFVRWNGGLDLIRLMTSAIERAQHHKAELFFAAPLPSRPQRLLLACLRHWRMLKAGAGSASNAGDDSGLLQVAAKITGNHRSIKCSDNRRGVLEVAHAVNADIVFPTMLPLGRNGPARIGYVFDFQHRHLPDLFTARTRRNRDNRFKRIADDSNGIVVNAQAVARDVGQFLDYPPTRILAMPFAPYALPWWFELDPKDAQRRHGVDGRYLLVCNHFWKHKDHATALRAFSLLRARPGNQDLQLVMTGDPIDHRDPGHYGKLLSLTSELGIAGPTHFLGLIPKRDQLALLRGCAALLQPTRFEGGPGGGSVYEAIGLGVPAIVSDIPVNLEIDQGDVRFFKTGDADELAKRTAATLESPPPRPTREILLARGNANLMRLGNAICNYLSRIVES